MTLNDAIKKIQECEFTTLTSESRNALHGATEGHPWCEGKSLEQRKLEVRFACAGRGVDGNLMYAVERATS